MIDPPQIVLTVPQRIAFIHVIVPHTEIMKVMGPGLNELVATLAQQGVKPIGPWFTYHLHKPTETFNYRICVAIDQPVTPAGRMQCGELPATTVARTVFHGSYESLGAAWEVLETWISGVGRKPAVELWERYLVGPGDSSNPADWRTELNRPLVA